MKFTLEHTIILILTVALIYYVVQHRNLLTDLFRIPDRGHPELKKVKEKHGSIWRSIANAMSSVKDGDVIHSIEDTVEDTVQRVRM